MKKGLNIVVQYAIEIEPGVTQVFNDEYLNIDEEKAIEKNKGKEIDFWTIYYTNSNIFKSRDLKTNRITYREE